MCVSLKGVEQKRPIFGQHMDLEVIDPLLKEEQAAFVPGFL